MEKTDRILFGKFKDLTWNDILTSKEGIEWGDWWSSTHSKGRYANRENQMKNVFRNNPVTPIITKISISNFRDSKDRTLKTHLTVMT